MLEQLISVFSKLPGLGPRSARRLVLHLLKNKEKTLFPLIETLQKASTALQTCATCGTIDMSSPCSICSDPRRDFSIICVVEDIADLWAIERSKLFQGHYHVLGGTLSALDGRGPGQLNIPQLRARASVPQVTEVILATNATVEGQTTAFYITDELLDCEVKISRLAHGIPIGGELDYLDDGTLGAALKARLPVS